jgi:hypothetical protein
VVVQSTQLIPPDPQEVLLVPELSHLPFLQHPLQVPMPQGCASHWPVSGLQISFAPQRAHPEPPVPQCDALGGSWQAFPASQQPLLQFAAPHTFGSEQEPRESQVLPPGQLVQSPPCRPQAAAVSAVMQTPPEQQPEQVVELQPEGGVWNCVMMQMSVPVARVQM